MSKWKDIGTLLREYGLISNDDLNEGLYLHKAQGVRLGEALVKLGKVTMEDIEWVLSKQLDVPFVIVEDVTVNNELLSKFQKDFLIQNRILPLFESNHQISVVIEDPFNTSALDHIRSSFGKTVDISTGSGKKIEELLKQTFKKAGLPELIDAIRNITERIQETSFYRIDFFLDENACSINVFGSGIIKHIYDMNGHFTTEEVFSSFDGLDIPFLYEQALSGSRKFLAVYPMQNEMSAVKLPAIIGEYGLVLPKSTAFSDTRVFGVSDLFFLADPVQGYPYFATKERGYTSEEMICTVDAAPADFNNYYVKTYIPRKCTSCDGAGCSSCKDLGYEFERIEGLYSTDELKEKLEEGNYGKD